VGILSTNYELIKEIGRGGMGIVHLANDKRLDRKVAIKALQLDPNMDPSDTEKVIQRFYKEGRSLAKLTHPNIVTIYDIVEENRQYYMIMELIEGKSLARLLQIKSPFAVDLVLTIGTHIANALGYIHSKGILHRDIKPGNIMLTEAKIPKLTDFGLAKLNDPKYSLTQTGSLFGSLMYIPPEQALGAKNLDHRADIYSLGITLYEALTGNSPFEDETIATIIRKVIEEEPIPPSSITPDIPPELDEIILKCVRKSPDERYQTAYELEKDFQKLIDSRTIAKSSMPSSNIILPEKFNSITTTFSGDSEDNFILSSLIQFLSLNNSTGKLSFWLKKDLQANLFLYEGNLSHAELGLLIGIDAICHMFCWTYSRGEFEFKEYQGEKLFYKSLENASIQQILKKVTERLDSCKYREYLHQRLNSVNKKVSLIVEDVNLKPIKEHPIKNKMYERVSKGEDIRLSELISNTHQSEMESCSAIQNMIDEGIIIPFANTDKTVPYSNLLHIVNLISKYTDKSVALKLIADKKSSLGLSSSKNISLKQLYRLSNLAYKEFNELLPEKRHRWDAMKQQLRSYIEELSFGDI